MRITHLTQIIRGHGGVQRVLREVLDRQARRGHDVRLLAIGDSELEEDLGFGPGVSVSWFTTSRTFVSSYSHQPGLLTRIRAEAQTPGVFHAHQHFAPPTLLAATTRAPKVLTPYLHVPGSVSRTAEARRRWQLRVVARRYRGGLVFLCESERDAFEDLAMVRVPEADIVPPASASRSMTSSRTRRTVRSCSSSLASCAPSGSTGSSKRSRRAHVVRDSWWWAADLHFPSWRRRVAAADSTSSGHSSVRSTTPHCGGGTAPQMSWRHSPARSRSD